MATIAQIKKLILELGFAPPSGYRKAELLAYYDGLVKMKQGGILYAEHKEEKLSYTPVMPDANISLKEHIKIHGWGVAKIPDFNFIEIRNELLGWLHEVCDRFNINDMTTWTRNNIPYNIHGIFKQWVGHLEPIWKTREACIPIFKDLWDTDNLLSSFDGFCLLNNKKRDTSWIHCDQGRSVTDFACLQGVVNLYPNGPNDGGTILMDGSHNKFKEYLDKYSADGIKPFYRIHTSNSVLKDCKVIKPCLAAGEILLWDSRVFHCNTPPTSNNPRMCVYVSMMPRSGATQDDLNKRKKLYEEGRMTGHWCYGDFMAVNSKDVNPMYTKDIPKPNDIKIATLNETRKKLIGY